MSSTRITYAPRPDATPEAEVSALAACYRIILDSAKKKGRHPDKDGSNSIVAHQRDDRR